MHNRVGSLVHSVVHSFFLLFLSCSSTVFLLPLSSPAPLPLRSIEAEGERSKNGEGTERDRSKSRTYHSSQSKKCTLGSVLLCTRPSTHRRVPTSRYRCLYVYDGKTICFAHPAKYDIADNRLATIG